jgi:hypothetical protein
MAVNRSEDGCQHDRTRLFDPRRTAAGVNRRVSAIERQPSLIAAQEPCPSRSCSQRLSSPLLEYARGDGGNVRDGRTAKLESVARTYLLSFGAGGKARSRSNAQTNSTGCCQTNLVNGLSRKCIDAPYCSSPHFSWGGSVSRRLRGYWKKVSLGQRGARRALALIGRGPSPARTSSLPGVVQTPSSRGAGASPHLYTMAGVAGLATLLRWTGAEAPIHLAGRTSL